MTDEKPSEKPAAQPPADKTPTAAPAGAPTAPAKPAAAPVAQPMYGADALASWIKGVPPITPSSKPPVENAADYPSELGLVGQFLAKNGIAPKRLADSCGVETLEIEAARLSHAANLLRNSSELQLNFLVAVSGVDSPDTFDSVYHLRSFFNHNEVVLKVRIAKSSVPKGQLPMVPSLATFWDTANWHERETYDLVGIQYVGHPYLRRILNPWDWEGHPLRKDYKQIVDALNDKNPSSFR